MIPFDLIWEANGGEAGHGGPLPAGEGYALVAVRRSVRSAQPQANLPLAKPHSQPHEPNGTAPGGKGADSPLVDR